MICLCLLQYRVRNDVSMMAQEFNVQLFPIKGLKNVMKVSIVMVSFYYENNEFINFAFLFPC